MSLKNKLAELKSEIAKGVIGQEEMVNSILIGLLTNGHILLEGVPGLAKTTTVKAVAQAIDLGFKRIQFTPDLLPSDIIGAQIFDMKTSEFKIKKGPIFTNLLLADEINRAPAKVQAALLEVMQERQITISDTTFKSPSPFLVMATENPVEQEGAYRLPEAQLDRFMMKVLVGYNTFDEEIEIVNRVAIKGFEQIQVVASVDDIINMKEALKQIHVDSAVKNYMTKLIFATRNPKDYDLDEIAEYIEFGASPRASIDLYKASIATALIRGKDYVTPLDISYVLKGVLRHRLILNFKARANGITTDYIIEKIIQKIKTP